MDLRQYLRVLRDRWFWVLACMLVGVLVAGLYTGLKRPMYAATTQLFVSTSGDQVANPQAAYQGGLFGQQRVKSYAKIVSSEPVVQRVKDELRLPDSIEVLRAKISATAPLDTVLLNVEVKDRSAVRARLIADSLGRQFAARVNELETPQGQAVSPVKVSVAQPPSLPSAPFTPRKKLNLLLGTLLGLVLGIGSALLRDILDTRLHDQDGVSELASAPVLGGFRHDDKVPTRPLIVNEEPFSPRAEAFRQLRTNIRFISVDHAVRTLVVTSSLAGEGKTTIAANLCVALAQSGEKVVLIDADLRRPVVGETFGVNPQVGLTNVLLEATSLDEALQVYRPELPLRILASGPVPPNPSELLGSQRMQEIVEELKKRFSMVIFDTPPLLPVTDAAVLAAHTDGALIIARANSTHREQLRTSVESLRRVGAQVLGVVLNRLPARGRSGGYGYGYNTYYGPRDGGSRLRADSSPSAPDEQSAPQGQQ